MQRERQVDLTNNPAIMPVMSKYINVESAADSLRSKAQEILAREGKSEIRLGVPTPQLENNSDGTLPVSILAIWEVPASKEIRRTGLFGRKSEVVETRATLAVAVEVHAEEKRAKDWMSLATAFGSVFIAQSYGVRLKPPPDRKDQIGVAIIEGEKPFYFRRSMVREGNDINPKYAIKRDEFRKAAVEEVEFMEDYLDQARLPE